MRYPAAVLPNTAVVVMGGRDRTSHDMSRLITVDQFSRRVIQAAITRRLGGARRRCAQRAAVRRAGKDNLDASQTGVVAFSLLGLVIWWRTRQTSRNVKGLVRIHRTAGLAASLFIISVAASCLWLNLTTWAEKASGRSVFAANMAMAGKHADMSALHPASDGNDALSIARTRFGDLDLAASGPPGLHAKNYWFAFKDRRLKRTDVLVDPATGQVIGVYPTDLTSGGEGARAWLFPVHSSYIVGRIGGLIYSIIGVSVSLWVLTGFLMWFRQRAMRRSVRVSSEMAAAADLARIGACTPAMFRRPRTEA